MCVWAGGGGGGEKVTSLLLAILPYKIVLSKIFLDIKFLFLNRFSIFFAAHFTTNSGLKIEKK